MIQKFMRDPSRPCGLFRRRPVARIDRTFEEFVRAVGPELAHRWIGLDDRVLQSSILFLDLADRDVEDRLTVLVELYRTIRTFWNVDVAQGLHKGGLVRDVALDLLKRIVKDLTGHVSADGVVARIGVVSLAHGLDELLIGGSIDGGAVPTG